MSLIFLGYFLTLILVAQRMRKAAYVALVTSTVLSIAMFAHHTTSSLDLLSAFVPIEK